MDDLNPTGYLQVMEEVVGAAVQTRYTFGTSLVSQTRNVPSTPVTSYYGYDAHGNVTFLTDATGAVTDSYDYDAWGMLVASTGATPNTRLYVGEEYDPDLGLINLRARQYRPEAGRFVTLDPIMGRRDRPVTMNRYLYASSDPIHFSDPTGLSEFAEIAAEFQFASKVLLAVNASFIYAGIKGHNDKILVCAYRSEVMGVAAEMRAPGTGGFVALFGTSSCIIWSPLTHFLVDKLF